MMAGHEPEADMSVTITDPALLAQLAAAPGCVELRDPSGRVIGTFFLEGYGVPPPGVTSPISDEEFEEARKSPSSGITLEEFWKRMQRDGKWR
jgi:hypothetical protein